MSVHNLGVPMIQASELVVPHGFFTRGGGVSTGSYESLNCGLSVGDSITNVRINRDRAVAAIGGEPEQLLGLTQVHGSEVVNVETPWSPGAGPKADAMVTARTDVILSVITGDCAPVLFADPRRGLIGVAHAGWRGAVAGVLEATVTALYDLGAQDIIAVIGPCIHQASYEVGDDVRDPVCARFALDQKFFAPGRDRGHWWFDLPGYCAARLIPHGVAATILPFDTSADEARFFSHRRRTLRGEGKGGLQISMIQARS